MIPVRGTFTPRIADVPANTKLQDRGRDVRNNMVLDKAPYTPEGHMRTYVHERRRHETVEEYESRTEWRDNTPFEATMELTSFGRGMSSARFHWVDHNGHRYEMFMKDMETVLKSTIIDHGVVMGKWRICKRGQNYGLQFVE